jgi:hypothetical protein
VRSRLCSSNMGRGGGAPPALVRPPGPLCLSDSVSALRSNLDDATAMASEFAQGAGRLVRVVVGRGRLRAGRMNSWSKPFALLVNLQLLRSLSAKTQVVEGRTQVHRTEQRARCPCRSSLSLHDVLQSGEEEI